MAESATESSVDVRIKEILLRWARNGLVFGSVFSVILVVNYFLFSAGRFREYSALAVFIVIPLYGALVALVFFLAGVPVRMWLWRQRPDPAKSDDYKASYLRREAEQLPGNSAAFVGFCGVVVFVVLLVQAGVQAQEFNHTPMHNYVVDAFEFLLGIGWLVSTRLSLSLPSVFAPALAAYLTGLVFRRGLSKAIAEDFCRNSGNDKP